MISALHALKAISSYPIPEATLILYLGEEGISHTEPYSDVANTAAFYKAKAKAYLYLVSAPDISQGGISFSIDSERRNWFKRLADDCLKRSGVEPNARPHFGFVGDDL